MPSMLVLNIGSSSLKLALFDADGRRARLRADVADIGGACRWTRHGGDAAEPAPALAAGSDHAQTLRAVLDWLDARDADPLIGVAHRIVHGGAMFTGPVRVDSAVRDALQALVPLAPLHQPQGLAAIDAVSARRPTLPQIAGFDTAFHAGQADVARCYALPQALTATGVRRYGFHGLSYQFIAGRLAQEWPQARRCIVAHLGSGASLCALRDGESIATTMGFTPLDGLPMATRCGSLDPGVVLYLLRQPGMDVDTVEALLSRQSGLLGVSGESGDMRRLLQSPSTAAAEAIELFCYRCHREIGSLIAALGGLDALVFTGGIGLHATEVRARIAALAGWTGIALDDAANRSGGPVVSRDGSRVLALVLATDEEAMLARLAAPLLSASAGT